MARNVKRNQNGTATKSLRAKVRMRGDPCAICGKPIDYTLPSGDPMSFELDHIVPVAQGGAEYDISNCQAAHRICNQRKGALKARPTSIPGSFPHSAEW